jgi:hypothetical protein
MLWVNICLKIYGALMSAYCSIVNRFVEPNNKHAFPHKTTSQNCYEDECHLQDNDTESQDVVIKS